MALKMHQPNQTLHDLEKPFACGNAADLRVTCTQMIILHTGTNDFTAVCLPEAPRVLLLSLHVGCCLLLPLNLHCKIGLFLSRAGKSRSSEKLRMSMLRRDHRQGKPPSTRCMPLMCLGALFFFAGGCKKAVCVLDVVVILSVLFAASRKFTQLNSELRKSSYDFRKGSFV